MAEVSPQSLAKEVSPVCTAGLGRPLRSNARCDSLIEVAQELAGDKTLPEIHALEKALTPSIERLGNGELGILAKIEFGLHPDTKGLRFLGDRRDFARKQFGIGNGALKRIERQMHLAVARDLIARRKALGGS